MFHLSVLSKSDIKAIHVASLRVLSETGIALTEPRSRALLEDAGAKVNGKRVFIPPGLVEMCLAQSGKCTSIRGRGGAAKTLGNGSLYFHNLGGAPNVYEVRTGKRHLATVLDVKNATLLLDGLENCHTITPFFTPTDVPGQIMALAMYRHALPNTIKPLQGPGLQTADEVRYVIEMAAIIGQPQELLTLSVSPVSPLSIPDHEAEAIMAVANAGIALGPLPCPTAGTTAPFSISGAITQQNAEVLAVLVLAQLVHPGLPIIYCGRLAIMEPRTGLSVWGGVEMGMASAGTVQVGHYYGLPVNVYGFSTNAHVLDSQNGFERGINAILPALAGADELSGIGEMEAGVMGSYAQMVMDNEFAGSILRIRDGFSADSDALAVNTISAAMASTNNFLSQKHTMKYLKKGEIFLAHLAERSSWDTWESGQRQGMVERAEAEARYILREHQVPPLESAQEFELDKILAAAEHDLVK